MKSKSIDAKKIYKIMDIIYIQFIYNVRFQVMGVKFERYL